MAIVTLTTDFGTADGYVGEMKGVILSSAPGITVVDITHDIEPQDIDGARLLIERCWRCFPPGTVHAVVVDPGVGSSRAAIAVESEGRQFVGPDNGVLSAALCSPDARAVVLPVPDDASATFHGRDVFAPVAARLASGVPLSLVGAPYASAMVIADPEPTTLQSGSIVGEVVHADRFGNAVTNIKVATASRSGTIEVAGRELPFVRTYADVAPGEVLALVGSSGRLEIAIRNGHAARTLGLARGSRVILTMR